jgi:probable phosphoglycerate mutase
VKDIELFKRPFYYLRHGETESNAALIVAGSLDVELTALGRQQAEAAAALLADEPITAIYSSPLKRALHTAEPIASRLKLPLSVIAEIAERSWGTLEGEPRASRVRGVTPEGGESAQAFQKRVLAGLAQIRGDVPLIVAHSGVFRVLCRTLAIVETEGPVANALPVRLAPRPEGGWKAEAVARL